VFQAQVPNMNPAIPETLIVFVRPTALPDLTVTSITTATSAISMRFPCSQASR